MRRVLARRKDGSVFLVELVIGDACGGNRRINIGFIRDLSDHETAQERQAKLQAELLHVSRLSAVGTMAGSLAHELNQPLTAVVNYVQAAAGLLDRARTPHYDDLHHALTEAGAEALRAGMIVHHLRHFIAKGELDRTVETIRPLIDDALTLCALGIRARAPRCRVQVGPDVGPVIVDRVQIQQVLVNLLRNAAEAIGDREGRVDIKVCADDGMVRISVSDNGPGIAPELAESLFNSFTSTKIQGIGLGLSICKTIVEAHGGKIWCDGGKENGTVFHFTLPRADMEEGV